MKLIHCADLHLDSSLTANLEKEKAGERNRELLRNWERLSDYAVTNGISHILVAGDLFDKKSIRAMVRNTVLDVMKSHPEITYYYLRGNHDDFDLPWSPEKVPPNLKTFGKDWISYEPVPGVQITGGEFDGSNGRRLYESLQLSYDDFHIVTLHGQTAEYHGPDNAENVELSALRYHNIDYLALGHVHEYRMGELDSRGKYCYSGCLEGRGFDECGEHGFVVLDIDESTHRFTSEFVPFAGRRIYAEQVDVSGCMTTMEVLEKVREHLRQTSIVAEDMLKVILTGNADVSAERDVNYILSALADDYYFVKIYDRVETLVDYTAFEGDLSLRGSFVGLVHNLPDLDEETKAEVIRCGLKVLRGEKV